MRTRSPHSHPARASGTHQQCARVSGAARCARAAAGGRARRRAARDAGMRGRRYNIEVSNARCTMHLDGRSARELAPRRREMQAHYEDLVAQLRRDCAEASETAERAGLEAAPLVPLGTLYSLVPYSTSVAGLEAAEWEHSASVHTRPRTGSRARMRPCAIARISARIGARVSARASTRERPLTCVHTRAPPAHSLAHCHSVSSSERASVRCKYASALSSVLLASSQLACRSLAQSTMSTKRVLRAVLTPHSLGGCRARVFFS